MCGVTGGQGVFRTIHFNFLFVRDVFMIARADPQLQPRDLKSFDAALVPKMRKRRSLSKEPINIRKKLEDIQRLSLAHRSSPRRETYPARSDVMCRIQARIARLIPEPDRNRLYTVWRFPKG